VANQSANEESCDVASLLIFSTIKNRLEEAVVREENIDYLGVRDSRRTFLIGRASLFMSMLLTLPVFYLIWVLVDAMGAITGRMEHMKVYMTSMHQDFEELAQLVENINGSVVAMSENMVVILPMEQRLSGMRGDFDVITTAMGDITPSVTAIDQILSVMDRDMAEMNHAFGFVNRDVFQMRQNVNQMSNPMRMLPFFGR
jgi:hypothetical protein